MTNCKKVLDCFARSNSVILITTLSLTGCGILTPIEPEADDPEFAPIIPDYKQAAKPVGGTLFLAGNNISLYNDVKAHKVGDVITVMLSEATQASTDGKTEFTKEYTNNTPNPTIFGVNPHSKIPGLRSLAKRLFAQDMDDSTNRFLTQDISSSAEFEGEGKSNQNNSLTGNITVTVAQVLPNKNLVIKGEKWIKLNKGEEFIRLSGIVRPQDVSPTNEVMSTKIANARIQYSSAGEMSKSNTPGLLSRLFNHPLFLF